jgi:hypothetical protein
LNKMLLYENSKFKLFPLLGVFCTRIVINLLTGFLHVSCWTLFRSLSSVAEWKCLSQIEDCQGDMKITIVFERDSV